MQATMHEAKTNLSKLVARARAGEEVILTSGKSHAPIARIVPIEPPQSALPKKRPLGMYAGQISIGPEFFEPLPEEELALWEAPIPAPSATQTPKAGEDK